MVALACCCLGLIASAAGAEPPALVAQHARRPLDVDGRLDEGAWKESFVARDFRLLGSEALAGQTTTARIVWTDVAIYVAFECHEANPSAMRTMIPERDGLVYTDDSVELFLSPWPGTDRYYHFVVNSRGVLRDELRQDASWSCGAVAAAGRMTGGWTVELSIPLAELALDGAVGSEWAVNFCRSETPHSELSSWAPCRTSFHEVGSFGRLTALTLDVVPFARQTLSRRLAEAQRRLTPAMAEAAAGRPLKAANVAHKAAQRAQAVLDEVRIADSSRHLTLEQLRAAEATLTQGEALVAEVERQAPTVAMSRELKRLGRSTVYGVTQESPMARLRPGVSYAGTPPEVVTISAARNEYEAAQIVITAIEDGVRQVQLAVDGLTADDGTRFDGGVVLNRIGMVEIKQPSGGSGAAPGPYPDPLLPASPTDIARGESAAWLVTLYVPPEQRAGDYEGVLTVSVAGQAPTALPLRLHVWDYALPVASRLRTAFQLLPSFLDKVYGLPSAPGVPQGWEFGVWTGADIEGRAGYFGTGVFHSAFDTAIKHSGARSLRITGEVAVPGTEPPRAAYHRAFAVEPGREYTVSVWYRTEGLSDGQAQLHVHTHNAHLGLPASPEWRQAELRFPTGDVTEARVYLASYGVGTVWFDDLRLAPSDAPPEVNLVTDSSFEEGGDASRRPALLRQYRLNMLQHRASDINIAAPEVTIDPYGRPVLDWTEFDREISFYVEHGLNAFNVGWGHLPTGWGTVEQVTDQARLAQSREILRQTEAHLAEKGWLDRAYLYPIDEPGRDAFEAVKQAFSFAKGAAPGLKRLLTLGYGASRPILPGRPVYARLVGSVDIWVPHSDCFEPEFLAERRAAGEEIWEYVCISAQKPYANIWGIDYPGTDPRVVFWQCFSADITGFLYWAVDYWPTDPWQDPQTYPGGNADGSLLYYDENGPVNSLRWETMRDGIEDYDSLVLLRDLVRQAEAAQLDPKLIERARRPLDVSNVTASFTQYTTDPAVIERHRTAVAEGIERLERELGP